MFKRKIMVFFLIGVILVTGCSNTSTQSEENTKNEENSELANMFTDRDKEVGYDEENSILINLSDNGSECDSDSVTIKENVITITTEGTYVLTGELSDGMVVVKAKDTDKVQLVLKNASISNADSAAIYVFSADKVFVTTAAESKNYLENGGTYVSIDENNIDSVVFAKSDLTLNGEGKLTIHAQAGHGVVSKDDLVFTSGTYEITSENQGISGKNSVRIADGIYKITSGKDGIHAENAEEGELGFIYIADGSFEIISQQDGISASSWLQTDNGSYTITTGKGASEVEHWSQQEVTPMEQHSNQNSQEETTSIKGLKANSKMIVKNGTYILNTEDDALHSNGTLTIEGGEYTISTGDDGIHADDNVLISAGDIVISQSYEGIEGLSIDITGGSISLLSLDDGMNAAGGNDSSGFKGMGDDQFAATEGAYINISNGTIEIDATGDGIDSNGDVTVSGGKTYVYGPTNGGNGSLDYNGNATISGGIFIAIGSSQMAQNFGDSSTQGVIMMNTDVQSASTEIVLTNSDGTGLISFTAKKEYSSIILSCPDMKQGNTYTLQYGSTKQNITLDSLIYSNGTQMSGEMRPEHGEETMPSNRNELPPR